MESESKRRKLNPPPRRAKKTEVCATENHPKVSSQQVAGSHVKVSQAKSFAVSQAQQEGSTANFRIVDSQFGNYLIPSVPTRAELSSS